MGYRSDVMISMPKILLLKNKDLLEDDISDVCQILEYQTTKGESIVILKWEQVKWYESYPDVITITEFITEHEDVVDFIRVGEEYDDIEILRGSDRYDLSIHTTIKTNMETKDIADEMWQEE